MKPQPRGVMRILNIANLSFTFLFSIGELHSETGIQNFEQIKKQREELQRAVEESPRTDFGGDQTFVPLLDPEDEEPRHQYHDWSVKGGLIPDRKPSESEKIRDQANNEKMTPPSEPSGGFEKWIKNYFFGVIVGYKCLKIMITNLQWLRVHRDEAAVECAASGVSGCDQKVDAVYQTRVKAELKQWDLCIDKDGNIPVLDNKTAEVSTPSEF